MTRIAIVAIVALGVSTSLTGTASAQSLFEGLLGVLTGGNEDSDGRELRATIWVDPDGCEHWVMDDGLEGFMSAHLDKSGKPVCRSAATTNGICKTLDSAATFDVGSAKVKAAARAELIEYFSQLVGKTIVVNGHTDATGSTQSNLDLSLRRAVAVSEIAEEIGVNAEPRGYGEQVPVASNDTAEGRSKNRRVELTCS